MMKHKGLKILVVLVVAALVGAAINVSLGKCYAAKVKAKTTISFWHACNDEVTVNTMRAIINRFQAKNKNVVIKYQAIPWAEDPHLKYQMAVAGGSIADVFTMSDPFELNLARGNALEPLDDYFSKTMRKDYPDWLIDRCAYNGKLVALPWYSTVRPLFYRKDLLKAAGVPEPTTSWTWEQFLKYAKMLTKDLNGDGIIDQYGFGTSGRYVSQFQPFLKENGADFVDEKKGIAIANTPEAIEALQFYVDLIRVHKVTPPGIATIDLHNIQKMFAEGKVAMFSDCEDTATAFSKEAALANKFGVGYLPRRERQAAFAVVDVLAIAKSSRNKKAAWQFLSHVLAAENVLEYCNNVGFTSFRLSLENNKLLQDPIRQGFIKQMKAGGYLYYESPKSSAFSRIIKAGVQEAIEGISTPKQAAETMQAQLSKELSK